MTLQAAEVGLVSLKLSFIHAFVLCCFCEVAKSLDPGETDQRPTRTFFPGSLVSYF